MTQSSHQIMMEGGGGMSYVNIVRLISSGFADTYKAYIQSVLEDLVKQVHSKLQLYCSGDISVKPRFYHLSERLALSEKVTTRMPCTCKLLEDNLNSNLCIITGA